jgi:NitT/TauT family transport system substrate-binding protein
VGLGIDQGFFKDEGLEVDYLTVGAPPATVASVQSGQVDVGSIPTLPAITAISHGVDILPFMSGSGYPRGTHDLKQYDQLSIYVSPGVDISSPAELEGHKVAIPSRGAVMEVLISDAVRNDGGDPAKVNWIVLDYGSQVSALIDGRVDAAGLSLPFTAQVADAGAELLMGPAIDFYEEGPLTTWIASPDTAADDDLLMRLQRAIQKSNAYANNHRDEAMAKASKITGIDEQLFREARGFNFYPVDLKLDDFQRASEKMHGLGFLKAPVDLEGKVRTAEVPQSEEAETP